jgi:hypothetical protein
VDNQVMDNIVDHKVYMDYPLVLEKEIGKNHNIFHNLIDLTWSAFREVKFFWIVVCIFAC